MPKAAKKKRIQIDGKWYSLKNNGKPGVELTHNDGWLSESAFFGTIRSALRLASKFWKPKIRYLEERSRPYTGKCKKTKKEYQCEQCRKWFVRAKIEVNHVNPCGSLKCFEDLPEFCRKLFIEIDGGWEVLCLTCHQKETNKQRGDRNG